MYDPVIGCMLSPDNFMQSPGFSQSLNRYSYCWNNPLKYTDPTGNELGVINRIGPGSGNHWSDEYRSVLGNFALMSSSTFMSYYAISEKGYNSLVRSWNGSGISQIDGKYYYFGNPVSYNSVHNNYFPSIADISLYGKDAADFYNSLTSDNNLAVYTYNNIFGSTVAILGFENQTPLLFGNDATGYKAVYGYGVYQGDPKWGIKHAGGGSMPGWAADANTGIGAFNVANGLKSELIDYAVRSNYKSARTSSEFNNLRTSQQAWRTTNTLGKTGARYLKYVKGFGYVGAGLTTTYSAANAGMYYYNGGTDWQVGTKATLDVIMTGVGFLGPIGFGISATYFILDATTGGFGGFGEIKP